MGFKYGRGDHASRHFKSDIYWVFNIEMSLGYLKHDNPG